MVARGEEEIDGGNEKAGKAEPFGCHMSEVNLHVGGEFG